MRRFVLLIAAGLLLVAARGVYGSFLADRAGSHSSSSSLPVPPAEPVRLLSLGFHTSAADLYWLRLLQEVGGSTEPSEWRDVYELVDLITDLDPLYGYAYEVGGTLLGTRGDLNHADRILAKGMGAVPKRWQLPYLRGFLAWYEQGRWADAAPLVLQAAKLPGSPAHLGELAARLFAEANDVTTGIAMVESLSALGLPPESAKRFDTVLQALYVERELRELESAIDVFRLRYGRAPASLAEILPFTALSAEELDHVVYDASSGTVRSRKQDARLGVRVPRDEPTVEPVVQGD